MSEPLEERESCDYPECTRGWCLIRALGASPQKDEDDPDELPQS